MKLQDHYRWNELTRLPLVELIKEVEYFINQSVITEETLAYKIFNYYLKTKSISGKQKEQLVAKLVSIHIEFDLDEGMCL